MQVIYKLDHVNRHRIWSSTAGLDKDIIADQRILGVGSVSGERCSCYRAGVFVCLYAFRIAAARRVS